MSSKCPKCGGKIKATYMKQTCPHCGVNLLYYKLDEQLAADARQAAEEVAKVEHFKDVLRRSTVKTPWHIVRLVLFFTPLLSMCLPMYDAGGKTVSLIGVILGIVNHGLHLDAWTNDYLFAVSAMVLVIVLSLAVIISSLFSATKSGYRRNIIFSSINTAALGVLSALVCRSGGEVRIGFYITLLIYLGEVLLHLKTAATKTKKREIAAAVSALLVAASMGVCALMPSTTVQIEEIPRAGELRVVSFNTAAPWGTPFDGTASKDRVERFCEYMAMTEPDLIGTQELNSAWLEYITNLEPEAVLSGYESYAVKRGGDGDENRSEMNGIFWKSDRFTALETNTFWLTETPETESRFTYTDENGETREAGCNRICSYAILQDKESGALLGFFNTHLDNSSEEAMNFGAKLIAERIKAAQAQYDGIRIVLTGDFNQTNDGVAYKTISAFLNDTTNSAKEQATWQDWGYSSTGDKPIDFIFTTGTAADYEVLNVIPSNHKDKALDGYVSDHYGVMADINFE